MFCLKALLLLPIIKGKQYFAGQQDQVIIAWNKDIKTILGRSSEKGFLQVFHYRPSPLQFQATKSDTRAAGSLRLPF